MGDFFVYSTFIGVLLFLFPVFLFVDSYVDVTKNRAWFSVSLYRFLRIFGGYGQLDREGIALHVTKKTAVFLPFDKMGDTRKKFEITKGFQLYIYHQIVETGGANSIYGIFLAAALQGAGGAAFSVLQTKHPFLSLKSSTVLSEKPCLKLTVRTAFIFNGLVLTIALIKKLLEALITWIKRKKSTASWKRQPSN